MVSREGLIAQGARRVATVATLSLEDVDDIIATRTLLECGAVDLLRRPAPKLDRLRQALDTLTRAPETNWQAVIDADRAFHAELVGLARSPRLAAAYAQLDAEIRRTMTVTTRAYQDVGDLQAEHADILHALERRAYGQAKRLLRQHFTEDAAKLAQVLRGDAAPPPTPIRRP
jgi:DNA-binding GntR family transcriptional regulator